MKENCAMSKYQVLSLVSGTLAAFGTIAVAIVAIWRDWFSAKVASRKLSLIEHNNLRGSFLPITNGPRSIYYHLAVRNSRSWARATNCRVFLKKLWRRVPDDTFHPVPLTVPLTLIWSPAELMPPYITW
jgi:hypothetical protein